MSSTGNAANANFDLSGAGNYGARVGPSTESWHKDGIDMGKNFSLGKK